MIDRLDTARLRGEPDETAGDRSGTNAPAARTGEASGIRRPALELKALVHDNLGETVYQMLSDALIKGQFRPGDRLKIRDLADQLGTSVTPVRDALLRLVQDRALTMRSARDTRVPRMTREDYLEIRAIRVELEGLAARMAARVATPGQIRDLEEILSRNEKALKRKDWNAATELNQIFHFQIAGIAGMPTLQSILLRLWMRMGPLIAAVYMVGGRDMVDHHYDVVEALRRGDDAAAAAAMETDITRGGRTLLDWVDETADQDAPR